MITAIPKVALVLSLLCSALSNPALDCQGCLRDEQHWGGGSPDEVYVFVPGQFTNNGVCNFNCTWTGCVFDGTISFTNNTGEWRGLWAQCH
jgi:hypothetical protein